MADSPTLRDQTPKTMSMKSDDTQLIAFRALAGCARPARGLQPGIELIPFAFASVRGVRLWALRKSRLERGSVISR
jgi:hypothetical protein